MEHGMVWGVKDSLLAYVEGLDDGAVATDAPAVRQGGGFAFPLVAAGAAELRVADEAGGVAAGFGGGLRFQGSVRLTGHWGMLDVELRDPRVELRGAKATLLIRERGGRDLEAALPFADLTLAAVSADDGLLCLEYAAALTGQGGFLLGGQYPAGQELDPVRLTLPDPGAAERPGERDRRA
jgi:hypothetical protein